MNAKSAKLARKFAERYRFSDDGAKWLERALKSGLARNTVEAAYIGGPNHPAHLVIAHAIQEQMAKGTKVKK